MNNKHTHHEIIVINFKNHFDVAIGKLVDEIHDVDEKDQKRVVLVISPRLDLTRPQKQVESLFQKTKEFKEYEKMRDLPYKVPYYPDNGEIYKAPKGDFSSDCEVWFIWSSKFAEETVEKVPPLRMFRTLTKKIEELEKSLKLKNEREDEILNNVSELANQEYNELKRSTFQLELKHNREMNKKLEEKTKDKDKKED